MKGAYEMSKIQIRYISHDDILSMNIDFKFVVDTVKKVLIEHAAGFYDNPPKPAVHPDPLSFFHAMPSYLPRLHAAGIKWVSGFSLNPAKGLPAVTGIIVMNDDITGFPIAVMDCAWSTGVRTAAVSALSAKYLARKNSEVLSIIGTGIQGRIHGAFLKTVIGSLKTLKVYDINKDIIESFKKYVNEKTKIDIIVESSYENAIRDADIIVTCTGKLSEPVYNKEWVKQGALVLPVHTCGWTKDFPYTADKFIADDWIQLKDSHAVPSGYYKTLPEPYCELGKVIAGMKPGRENDKEIILCHNMGIALHDMALAQEIIKIAENKNIGTILPLMDISKNVV